MVRPRLPGSAAFGLTRERENMKKAAHSRVDRLLPALIVLGLTASAVSAGVNVWTTNGPGGIDIRALAIDPANPATLYAGSYGNGVFKSTDSGGTWVRADTGLANPYINALVIGPAAPATLYAGTDGGVYKSTDSGGAWVAVNAGLRNVSVGALAIDPSNPATLYAGTWDGLFKSTNSGDTWIAAGLGSYVFTLAIDPSNPTTLYAGKFGPEVFKSTDSGGTWAATGAGPNDPWGYDLAPALAISATTPVAVYAGTTYGVFKSTDGGASWTLGNTGLPHPDGLTYNPVLALAIAPSAPATLFAGTFGAGVFKSNDRGATWAAINDGLTNLFVKAIAIDRSNTARIYAGTEGGVYEYLRADTSGPCVPDPTTLCLNGSRFKVTTNWTTRDGRSASGRAVAFSGGEAGYFWFFGASNVEVVVKVLNGCGVNSRYWTFACGLTDVNVVLTVTDTQTGTVRTYVNPQGTPLSSIQDTDAFSVCP